MGCLPGVLRRSESSREAADRQKTLVDEVRRVYCAASPAPDRNDHPACQNFAKSGEKIIRKWRVSPTADLAMTELVGRWTRKGCRKGECGDTGAVE